MVSVFHVFVAAIGYIKNVLGVAQDKERGENKKMDFAEQLIEEIVEERKRREKEGQETLERLSKHPEEIQ